ncbi:MAG TPA: hypothetical protein VKV16_09845 [Solirubrobacteraceae bacterium]|nr:hypothetical protein [Solirubrobacteraceae bacterium]
MRNPLRGLAKRAVRWAAAKIRTPKGTAIAVSAVAAVSSLCVLKLGFSSGLVADAAYLVYIFGAIVATGLTVAALIKTAIGTRLALSVGVACAVPGGGALANGSPSFFRTIMVPNAHAARAETFLTLLAIVAPMTFALAIEMRVMGKLPENLERERRMTLAWLCIGGGALTTACTIAGSLTAAAEPGQPIDNTVASLLGASAYGAFVVTVLVVALAAVPRDGFDDAVEREERALRAEGRPSRRRERPAHTYFRRALPAIALAALLAVGAAEVRWIAFIAFACSASWLWHAWRTRDRAPRADQKLPLHPITFTATVLAGIALTCVVHSLFPGLRLHQTTTELYPVSLTLLGAGYVAFAGGHPREHRTGLLPSVHTIGVWCGIAAWAGLGLACCAIATAYGGGWFTFWTTMLCIGPMLLQVSYSISPAFRRVPS